MDDMLMESDGVSGELMPVSDEEWERMQQLERESMAKVRIGGAQSCD